MGDEAEAVAEAGELVRRKAYRRAVALLKPYLKGHPEDAAAWALLSSVYSAMLQHPEAERAAARVVRLRPGDAKAWFNWGLALRVLGKFHEAEDAQRRALELDPVNDRARDEIAAMAKTPWMHKPRWWGSPALFLAVFGASAAVLGWFLLWHRQWTMVYGEALLCGAGVCAVFWVAYVLVMGGREAERLLLPRASSWPRGTWWRWAVVWVPWYCGFWWLAEYFKHLRNGSGLWFVEGLLVGMVGYLLWYRTVWRRAWEIYRERQAAAER